MRRRRRTEDERSQITNASVLLRLSHRGEETMMKAQQNFLKLRVAVPAPTGGGVPGGVAADGDEIAEVSVARISPHDICRSRP